MWLCDVCESWEPLVGMMQQGQALSVHAATAAEAGWRGIGWAPVLARAPGEVAARPGLWGGHLCGLQLPAGRARGCVPAAPQRPPACPCATVSAQSC